MREISNKMKEAVELQMYGEFQDALKIYLEVIEKDPKNERILANIGSCY